MSSLDNGADIPRSSTLDQVSQQILAEQAQRALHQDSLPQLPLLPPLKLLPAPYTGQAFNFPSHFPEETLPLTDRLADKIYPGLGRIQSTDKNHWRLDYLDTRRCKGKSGMGMCFTLKWR